MSCLWLLIEINDATQLRVMWWVMHLFSEKHCWILKWYPSFIYMSLSKDISNIGNMLTYSGQWLFSTLKITILFLLKYILETWCKLQLSEQFIDIFEWFKQDICICAMFSTNMEFSWSSDDPNKQHIVIGPPGTYLVWGLQLTTN